MASFTSIVRIISHLCASLFCCPSSLLLLLSAIDRSLPSVLEAPGTSTAWPDFLLTSLTYPCGTELSIFHNWLSPGLSVSFIFNVPLSSMPAMPSDDIACSVIYPFPASSIQKNCDALLLYVFWINVVPE